MIIKLLQAIVPNSSSMMPLIYSKGFELFKAAIEAKGKHISDEDAQVLWNKATHKIDQETSPTQPIRINPNVAAQPAPAQVQPAAQAAKSLGELLAKAGSFSTPEEFTQIGNALVNQKNALLADKARAAQFLVAFPIIKNLRVHMPHLNDDDLDLLKKLQNMARELGTNG